MGFEEPYYPTRPKGTSNGPFLLLRRGIFWYVNICRKHISQKDPAMLKPYPHWNNIPQTADEDDEEESTQPKSLFFPQLKERPWHAFEQKIQYSQIHFYLSKEIGDPHEYVDMIHRIKVAQPGDVIFIHLNSDGGRIDTGVQIINAMQSSQAKIVTVLDSKAFSLATMIFLAGDEFIVHDHAIIMFHNFKGGTFGKGNEMVAQLDASVKWFSALARKLYVPFLTNEEVDRLFKGEDIWMQSADIRKRLDSMVKQDSQEQAAPKKRGRKKATSAE